MLLPVESILEGTWGGSEPPPAEYTDFTLMQGMGWSWEQLQQTPEYVQRYCADLMGLTRAAEARAQERANRPRGVS